MNLLKMLGIKRSEMVINLSPLHPFGVSVDTVGVKDDRPDINPISLHAILLLHLLTQGVNFLITRLGSPTKADRHSQRRLSEEGSVCW